MEWTTADLINLRNVLCIHQLFFLIKKKKVRADGLGKKVAWCPRALGSRSRFALSSNCTDCSSSAFCLYHLPGELLFVSVQVKHRQYIHF